MNRALIAAAFGVLVGIVGTVVFDSVSAPGPLDEPPTIVRDIADVPRMSIEEAAGHRETRYEKLRSVSNILALPSEFSQTEALYVLAGRSDSGAVQHLLHEANRIGNDSKRKTALTILFARLTELDPRSALALARSNAFSNGPDIEAQVWESWGRMDLGAALDEVAVEPNLARRHFAIQALYTATGFIGNELTERIEAETGTPPDDSVREQYLYRLAERSIGDAIAWITAQTSRRDRLMGTYWLGQYLSRQDPVAAASYADRFDDEDLAERYRHAIAGAQATARPEETLARLLNGPSDDTTEGHIQRAMHELARRDVDSAIRFFESTQSARQRSYFGRLIVQELANQDPARALQWARDNDPTGRSRLLIRALGFIAESDPQQAMAHASQVEHVQQRRRAMSQVVSSIADHDPSLAARYVEQLDSPRDRTSAAWRVAMHWMRDDPVAAIGWLEDSEGFDSTRIVEQASSMFMETNLDAAIEALPRLQGKHAAGWRRQIAEQLAAQRSPAQAMDFIRTFDGTEEYDELHATVAGSLAKHDIASARRLADQLGTGPGRDRAYAQLVMQRANTHPGEAASWLSRIGDDERRAAAGSELARAWQSRDAEAAAHWAGTLPRGALRDSAIAIQVHGWREMTPSRRLLVDSIGDAEQRAQAWFAYVSARSGGDADEAKRVMRALNLTAEQQEQVQALIERSGNPYR